MLELMIGGASFFCGFAVMFAIHRVMFDYYDEDAQAQIYELKQEIIALKQAKDKIEVIHQHVYAAPDDVTNIQFWED